MLFGDIYGVNKPVYSIGMGLIKSANPYAHVYAVMPMWRMSARYQYILGIPLGVLGNSDSGVQVQCSYNYGDRVLILYPENYMETGRTELCYILGAAIPEIFVPRNPADVVYSKLWSADNLGVNEFTGFEKVQKLFKISSFLPNAAGHGSVDMLPGDFEAAGRDIALRVSDYVAGFASSSDVRVFLDSLYSRWVEKVVIKTTSTVAYKKDIAIIKRTTLASTLQRGNVDADNYRIITQTGDALYGSQTTVLSEDGITPLTRDYIGYDGTRQIYSANRLCIGKIPGIKSVVYRGQRLSNPDELPVPQPGDLIEPVKQKTSDENWLIKESDTLLIDDWYPQSFVDPELSGYPDDEPVKFTDSVMGDIPVTKKFSHLEFQDDGSIKLIDAWGSYILMSHGNVEIHAMNNLFTVSARDTLNFAGANRTDYASKDLAIQAYGGDLRLVGGKDIRMLGAAKDFKTGRVILESRNEFKVMSKDYHNDAESTTFVVRDVDTLAAGGRAFQILVPDGQLVLAANSIRAHGMNVSISSNLCLFTLTDNPMFTGNLTVRGGIGCETGNVQTSLVTPEGKIQPKTFYQGNGSDIINKRGGIRLRQDITAQGQLIVAGNVCGASYSKLTTGSQEKIIRDGNSTRLLNETRKLTWTAAATPQLDNEALSAVISVQDNALYRFNFGEPSKSCQLKLGRKMPNNDSGLSNRGYIDRRGNIQYIYPGQGFWEKDGVLTVDNKPIGFKTLANASANN